MRIQLSESSMLRLPKIGNIRKGIKVPVLDGHRKPKTDKFGKIVTYPKELPHFIVNFDSAYPEIKQRFEDVYGKEPTSLNCFLAASDADRVWMSAYEAYTYSQRIGVSNGSFVDYLVDATSNQVCIAGGVLKEHPTNPNSAVGRFLQGVEIGEQVEYDQDKPGFSDIKFAAKGRLNVIIAELNERAFLTVHTGGRYGDVPHLEYMVDDIFELARGINRSPIMIPFTLTRYEVERKYEDKDGKTKKRIGWDIQMKISPKVFEGVMQAYLADPIRLIAESEPRMFPAPEDYIEVDSEQAFIPETAESLPIQEVESELVPEGTAQQVEAPAPNQENLSRPYSPEVVKQGILNKVEQYAGEGAEVGLNDYKVLASTLDTTLGDKTKRYEMCQWLVGIASTKDMEAAEIKALLVWQGVSGFGEMPSDHVLTETRFCHTAALKASRKQEWAIAGNPSDQEHNQD